MGVIPPPELFRDVEEVGIPVELCQKPIDSWVDFNRPPTLHWEPKPKEPSLEEID